MSEGAAKKEERRKFQAIRGTRDLLPPETALWNRVEETAREVFASYGFGEIRLPVFEQTELFARAVGGETDIVSKEMYTFQDPPEFTSRLIAGFAREVGAEEIKRLATNQAELLQRLYEHKERAAVRAKQGIRSPLLDLLLEPEENVESLSLRPEATASVCRAYIEENMQQWPQPVKLYTVGPMFRRERPQKGRYRQFYQIDAEVLGGSDAPGIDAELIEMVMTFFERLGLQGVQLHINSIGDKNCRPKYVELLRDELRKVKDKLGPDSQRRMETNPLRVLDSKLESEQDIIEKLPRIAQHLCDACRENYDEVKRQLALRGIVYSQNFRLVRGLDYYVRTTFEITAKGLGSQNAVCGGGRYDGLIELLGGPPTRATGFAIGEDRLILSLQEQAKSRGVASEDPRVEVYIAWMGEKAYKTAIHAAKNLRAAGFSVELPPVEQKFGKALGQADKLGARYALILGDNEVASGEWTLKTLATGEQQKLSESRLLDFLGKKRSGE
ncbi:MAG: histidine--tRNA ligase [Acidobacteria bacterium]|nr:MAG: histidine--tRNA ligase [Acidobacteriota bacterium]